MEFLHFLRAPFKLMPCIIYNKRTLMKVLKITALTYACGVKLASNTRSQREMTGYVVKRNLFSKIEIIIYNNNMWRIVFKSPSSTEYYLCSYIVLVEVGLRVGSRLASIISLKPLLPTALAS